MDISRKIALLLQDKGMRLERLAKKAGISLTSLHRYLSGRAEPSAKDLERISEALEIPVYILVGGWVEESQKTPKEKGEKKPSPIEEIRGLIEGYSSLLTSKEKLSLIRLLCEE